ncbi:MAG: hypothetical protein DRI86_12995 [Bacteroidetes bacterium]|nr:MAG: hypothetical protein DRI86_12995 [Bacteroidota bacterium]
MFLIGQKQFPLHFYLQSQAFYGIPIIYSDSLDQTLQKSFIGGSFRIGVQSDGEFVQNQLLGFPKYGFGVFHTHLNKDTLGSPWAAYIFTTIPIIRKKKFLFELDMATGLGWHFAKFDSITNNQNDLVGSDFTAYFSLGAITSYRISNRLILDIGADFIHFSNGNLQTPNKGMNLYAAHMGLSYLFNMSNGESFEYASLTKKNIKPIVKHNELDFTFNIGGKATNHEYGMGPIYPIYAFTTNFYRRYNWIGKYGGGIDVIYDSSLKEDYSTEVSTSKLMFVGITVAHELYVSKFALQTQIGTYLYKGTSAKGAFYFRIGLKYYIIDNFYLNLTLKTANGFKADFIEFGMGYNIKLSK